MSQADLLVSLLKTASSGNQQEFTKTAQELIARERSKGHAILADRLARSLQQAGAKRPQVQSINNNQRNKKELFFEQIPERGLTDLTLAESIKQQILEVVDEQHKSDVLHAHNLNPRNKILLAGEPGNGKTSLAEAIAYELMVPLLVVRYDSLIGSYLGETSTKLSELFNSARKQRCVLFFDEFEALSKERSDSQETGEMKRVVSALLLQIDDLPDYVVTIAATNHHQLLDKAVWRRFQLKVELSHPTRNQLKQFITRLSEQSDINFGYESETLAKKLLGHNFAEAEEFCLGIMRAAVLQGNTKNAKNITKHKLQQWRLQLTPNKNNEE